MKKSKMLFAIVFVSILLLVGIVLKKAENKLFIANEEIENLKSQVGNQALLIERMTDDYNELNDKLFEIRQMNGFEDDKNFDRFNYEINFVNGNKDKMTLTYYVKESTEDAQVVNVIGNNYTIRGESYSSDRIEIKGSGENEYIKFIIFGDVYDFGLYSLAYINSDIQNAERELEEDLGNLSNIEVIIETTLPEGLPGEVVRWRDAKGNLYEEYISYDGLGASGKLRISY